MNELKPCPFCGGQAELKVSIPQYYGAQGARVVCTKCKAGTNYKRISECFSEMETLHTPITDASRARGEQEAINAWNTRDIPAGSISADRIAYNDAVGFYDPKSVTNPNRLTNADRIRQMSDEELADVLQRAMIPPKGRNCSVMCEFGRCRDCWLDWLKSPVEDVQ